jgi:hypothetical protein
MPCTLHIHGESVAVTQDASIRHHGAIVNGTKYLTVTRQSDLLKVQVVPGQSRLRRAAAGCFYRDAVARISAQARSCWRSVGVDS